MTQLTFFVIMLIVSVLIIPSILVRALLYGKVPGARPLAALAALMMIWLCAYLAEILVPSFEAKITSFNVRQLGVAFLPVAWFVLAWEFRHQQHFRPGGLWALLLTIPIFSTVLVWTSGYHTLLREGLRLVTVETAQLVQVEHGVWFAIEALYGAVALGASAYLLVRGYREMARPFRWQGLALVAGLAAVAAGGALTGLGLNPIAPLGLITLSFLPCLMLISLALFRHRLLDLRPMARDKLMEMMPDGALLVDDHGRIVDYNPAFQRLMGVASAGDTLVGRSVSAVLAAWPQWMAAYSRRNESRFEIVTRNAGRSAIYDVRVARLDALQGHGSAYLTLVRDISMRKRAEIALRASEERHRLLAENASDLIFTVDTQGQITYLSPSARALLGVVTTSMLGRSIDELLGPGIFERVHVDMSLRRTDPESTLPHALVIEIEIPRADTDPVWMEVSFTRLARQRQELAGYVGVGRDIGARRAAERQALDLAFEREHVRILERFLADVSHDLRTPLSILNTSSYIQQRVIQNIIALMAQAKAAARVRDGEGVLQLLEQTEPLLVKMLERARVAEGSAVRVSGIVNGMLEMSHYDRSGALNPQPQDLNSLLEAVVASYRARAAGRHIALRFEPGIIGQPVRIDEMPFTSALQKLIDNGLQYTPENGSVTLKTYQADEEAVIEVSDTGIGISKDDQARIFERFYRADPARSVETGGAGLGLAIAKWIVQAHQGQIEVESAVGAGSVFRIRLPLHLASQHSDSWAIQA
jgi:PAS domain S-box-containing protein